MSDQIRLELENIGGFESKETFKLKSNTLNIIKGSNSSGKSSIIKGLVTLLSLKSPHKMPTFFIEEAKKLGLFAGLNSNEGIINVHKNSAYFSISQDSTTWSFTIDINGSLQNNFNSNPKILYSSVLTKNSKIFRQLKGIENEEADDFSWIVNKLSKVFDIEPIYKRIVEEEEEWERINHICKNNIATLENKLGRIKYLNKELVKLEKLKKDLEKKFDASLDEQITNRNVYEKELQNLTKKILSLEHEIESYEIRIKKTSKELKELTKKKIELKNRKLDIEKVLNELNLKITNDIPIMEKKIEGLKQKRAEYQGALSVYQSALVVDKITSKCPLCNSEGFSIDTIREKIDKVTYLIKEKNNEIRLFNEKINEIRVLKSKKQLELDKIMKELESLNFVERKIQNELKRFDNEFKSYKNSLNNEKEKVRNLKNEICELNSIIAQKNPVYNQQYSSLLKKIEKLNKEKNYLERDIEALSVTVLDRKFLPKAAYEISKRYLKEIQRVRKEINQHIQILRKEVATKFNTEIVDFMEKLNFKEFKTIRINDEYRLIIERYDESKQDYIIQKPQTLSESEISSIAIILLIAMKETFTPQQSFLLIDGIIEDLDEERKNVFLDFLKNRAINKKETIIVTKVLNDQKLPLITEYK